MKLQPDQHLHFYVGCPLDVEWQLAEGIDLVFRRTEPLRQDHVHDMRMS